MPEDGQYGRNM